MQTHSRCGARTRRAAVALVRTPFFFALTLNAQSYRFARAWDGEKIIPNAVITIDHDRIKSIGTTAPADAIDMTRYTALPGLIDVHTHMTYVLDMTRITQSGRGAASVYMSQDNAKKTLETGVTTVRNLGASDYTDIAMRDLINAGLMTGPRMFVSGYGLQITRGGRGGGPQTADGVTEVMKVVRQQVGAGADVIKMYGSTGSGQDVTGFQTFTYDEMKAAVDTAHALGKTIAIHTYGPTGARDAVRAGADSIEHATDMDDETIAEMARKKLFYVPTIDHNRYYVDNARLLRYPPGATDGLNDYIRRNLESAKKAHKAGVRFAMGSDVVYTMFGENTRELAWFVKAGMTPEQALKTATTNAAELLQKQNELGALKPGYFADICAVEGNPLDDINVAIQKVRWVMKGGAVVVDKTK
ncbi:MAG TPA: amidohydrolase family protein [Bryobacteraceae bacterium]|jgi:imidazolonepropionase-like amidohydrolase|nr:amidohydrolase family protein [Bryobacteraceae bacterium]